MSKCYKVVGIGWVFFVFYEVGFLIWEHFEVRYMRSRLFLSVPVHTLS